VRRPGLAPVLLLAALLAASFLVFAAHVYPVPTADSYSFLPPALSFEAGRGLRNPVSDLALRLDPAGEARYVQYPPLFQLALALLMTRPTPGAAFLALGALNALNLLLSALLLARTASQFGDRRDRSPRAATLAAGVGLLGLATGLLGHQMGRPEVLATLWVLLSLHLHLSLPPERSWAAGGVLLGLLGATHPMGGLVLGLLTALSFAARRPTPRALLLAAGALAASLATFAILLALSPFGLRETLAGTLRHAEITLAARHAGAALTPYWISNPGSTFYALPYLLLVAGLGARAVARRISVRSPALFTALLLPLLAIAWSTGVRTPELTYNLFLFAPAVFAANLALASGRTIHQGAVLLAHGAAAAGYLRTLVLFGFFLAHGVPLEEARDAFRRILPEHGRAGVTPSLWVLSEEYERMIAWPAAYVDQLTGAEVFVAQQNYSGRQTPPELPGFRLVENRFLRRPCEVLGVRLANTVPGYAYAVYRRIPEGR
jgi:hypothetical protein